jgi:hypothetical protein
MCIIREALGEKKCYPEPPLLSWPHGELKAILKVWGGGGSEARLHKSMGSPERSGKENGKEGARCPTPEGWREGADPESMASWTLCEAL